MNISNQNEPAVFPTIEFHRRNPRKDEDDFLSSTQVMVSLRQREFNDIVRRTTALKPLAVTTPAKGELARQNPKMKPQKSLWRLLNLCLFRRMRFGKAHV
ncbi:MAG: hypothetical protein ACI8XO_002830 [Verrucomicrobiales bacterium]|jgi:hypothetical protein